jgi:paraquat-inducible protein B
VQKRGLRAQLKTQSLVTGKLYVDLGLHPDTPVRLVGLDVGVPEIPSVPTELEELKQTLQSAAARISELPLEEIVENLRSVTASLDRLLADPALESTVANLDATLAETRELVSKLNGSFGDFEGDVDATLAEARKTFAGANAAIADARALVAPGSPLQYQLSVLLEELSRATRAVRALSESLARDPDQLIFGRGKPGGSP